MSRAFRHGPEPLAQVIDRAAAHGVRPAERAQRHQFNIAPGVRRGGQRLPPPRRGLRDVLDRAAGRIIRLARQHMRSHRRIPRALRERQVDPMGTRDLHQTRRVVRVDLNELVPDGAAGATGIDVRHEGL